MRKNYYNGDLLSIHYNEYKDKYIVSDLFNMETMTLDNNDSTLTIILDSLMNELRLQRMESYKFGNDTKLMNAAFVSCFGDKAIGEIMLNKTKAHYNECIKQYKEEFYNAIVNGESDEMYSLGLWLSDFWDNDNDLFNENYPFDLSFDEVIFEGLDYIKKNTKMEDIRKWAF